jgi:hypothetical protein
MKIHNMQINAERTKQNNAQANTFSKQCEDNIKKFDIKYTRSIQQNSRQKLLHIL